MGFAMKLCLLEMSDVILMKSHQYDRLNKGDSSRHATVDDENLINQNP